jgi:hypothetical protein
LVVCRAGDEHEITGVRVDHGKDVPSKKLKAVRAAVEAVADMAESMSDRDSRSLNGKVQHIATLNPGTGKTLKRRLSLIRRKNSTAVDGA